MARITDRSLGACAVTCVLAVLTGCGQEASPGGGAARTLRSLIGEVVSDTPVVVPDDGWKAQPNGRWFFKTSARLLCALPARPDQDLVFRLEPFEPSAKCHVAAFFDGEPLFDARQFAVTGEEIRVPAARLGPGLHTLELRRVPELDKPRVRRRKAVMFEGIAFGIGRANRDLRASAMERHRLVQQFISLGQTGVGAERSEGALFVGPGRKVVELELRQRSRVAFRAENAAGTVARFTLAAGEQRRTVPVGPRQSEWIELELPAGDASLTLQVEGPDGGLFVWGAPFLTALEESAQRTPVVLITIDTTRRDALSVYGAPDGVGRNLADFASGATVYDNAYATGSWTLPTHASMFTGLYPFAHGAGVVRNRLARPHETLAEIFRDDGYFTAGFAGGMVCSTSRGLAQGFLAFRDPDLGIETRGDRLTDAVAGALDRHGDKPLFLFVNYFDPHALFAAPADYQRRHDVGRLRQAAPKDRIWASVQNDMSSWYALAHGKAEVTDGGRAYLRAAYLAEVAFMDDQIGRLFALLRERGIYERALIAIVADHGELLGENGYVSHGTRLDPELVWVPMMVKWPGQTEGVRSDDLVSHVDLFPTVLEAALGVAPADLPDVHGISLCATAAQARADRAEVLMEEHDVGPHELFDHMKIADHLFGAQRRDFRELIWQGGISAQRMAGGVWVDAESGAAWEQRMEQLGSMTSPGEAEAEAFSEADRAALRALGYAK